MTNLYSIRSTPTPGEFTIMKFDRDYNVESVYALNAKSCTCPAGAKPSCRHRKLLPEFIQKGHVDSGWFLDWDTRLWRKPVGEAEAQAARSEATSSEQLKERSDSVTSNEPSTVVEAASEMLASPNKFNPFNQAPSTAQAEPGAFCVSGGHVLYQDGDADIPDQIKDRNGSVVLALCRICGKGEIELKQPCIVAAEQTRLHLSAEVTPALAVRPPEVAVAVSPSGGSFKRRRVA